MLNIFFRLFKLFSYFIIVGILIYIFLSLFLFYYQNRLIFFPSSQIQITPDEIGLDYEDIWISIVNKKGEQQNIHGWWIPNYSPNSSVLLYLHGNGYNISANLGRAELFHQLGFSVFLIDYRGYGRSEGEFPTEMTVYQDAQLAYDYLVERRGIKPSSLFLYGHSLGGAIAINLAVNRPENAGIIVENTLTSMRDLVKHLQVYRIFPLQLILTQKFDSISKINQLKSPILIIHGAEDVTIPAWMSQGLYEQVKVPKKLLIVDGADHNNVASVRREEYLQTVDDFRKFVKSFPSIK
jgi:pimeloyl-ACP methyl ester carboxylesterase